MVDKEQGIRRTDKHYFDVMVNLTKILRHMFTVVCSVNVMLPGI
jgi:hypothetical protein